MLLSLRPLLFEYILATTECLSLCMFLFQMFPRTLLLRFSEGSGIILANLDSSCSYYSSFIFVLNIVLLYSAESI